MKNCIYLCIMEAKQLKLLRETADLSQLEVATKLEIHQSHISKWENGTYSVSRPYKKMLLNFFNDKLGEDKVKEIMQEALKI